MFNLSEIWEIIILYAPTVLCMSTTVIQALKLHKIDITKPINRYVSYCNAKLLEVNKKLESAYQEIKLLKEKNNEIENNVIEALTILANTVKDTQEKLSEIVQKDTELKAEIRRKKGE